MKLTMYTLLFKQRRYCNICNKKFNNIERKDLKALNEDYESVWVEIKNKFSKNIVTGCIYRHPRYNFKEFICYLENCLTKLTKENKEIYLCGDFNIELMKIDNNQNYQQFYNMLCSFAFSLKSFNLPVSLIIILL